MIYSLNCNSLNNKISELKNVIYERQPDVVCLCETWLSDRFVPKFNNYIAEWKHRGAAGGGLGILMHRSVQFRTLDIPSYTGGVLEAQVVRIYLRNSDPLHILNIYNPNKNITVDELDYYLNRLGNKFLIIGDFNAHSPVLDSTVRTSNPTGRSIEALLLDNAVSLINPLNMGTYIDRTTGRPSCLDLCFSAPDLSPHTSIAPMLDVGSDHLLLEIVLSVSPEKYTWQSIPRFKITKDSTKKFNQHYISSKIRQPSDLQTTASDFMARLTESANECFGSPSAPTGKVKKRTPWWSDECHEAVRNRRRAFRLFQKRPTMDNLRNYKSLSTIAQNTVKQSKKNSLHDYISTLTHTVPQNQIWKKIKAFKSSYTPQSFPLEVNGRVLLTAGEKAEAMSLHLKTEPIPNDTEFKHDIEAACKKDEYILGQPVSSTEFETVLGTLKDTTPGFDNVSNRMLKELSTSYKSELLSILNFSLCTGVVPETWKYGHVILILKPGKPAKELTSYRPITLLPSLGKLLERIVKNRLEYYLEHKKILCPSQFGFRPGRNTDQAVLKLSNQILHSINSSEYCIVVYIDLKAAFDGVWRSGLLYKMSSIGIHGNMLKWVGDYLSGRTQSVVVHGAISDSEPSEIGVPQGGVLSPLLFNIMMQDMPLDDNIHIYTFADDITLACSGPHLATVVSIMQTYLDSLGWWFDEWKFTVNSGKTKFQFFTRKRVGPPSLTLCDREIEPVRNQRLLGVMFDAPRLTWKSHVEHLVTNCTRRINIMKSFSSPTWGASHVVLRRFYIAYIRAKLCYCCTAFSIASKTHLAKLNKIQNSCLRLILGALKSSPILSLQAESNVPPLEAYMEFRCARSFVKMHFGPSDDLVFQSLCLYHSQYKTHLGEVMAKYDLSSVGRAANSVISEVPPWSSIQNKIIESFSLDLLSTESFGDYLEDEFPGFLALYTDGSKIVDPQVSVASAFYSPSGPVTISWLLHPQHTVLAAELFGLLKCLQYVDQMTTSNCVIFTDSLTSLQILKGRSKTYMQTIDNIKKLLLHLNTHRTVLLHWVKSHVGIQGNECADKAANMGHNSDRSVFFPLHREEFLCILREKFTKKWHQCWRESCISQRKGLFLYDIRGGMVAESIVDTGCRTSDCIIFRMRIGHAALNKHLHKIGLSETDQCPHCGEVETIEHFLLDCNQFFDERSVMFVSICYIVGYPPRLTQRLLLGGGDFSAEKNRKIIRALAIYIRKTGRFN